MAISACSVSRAKAVSGKYPADNMTMPVAKVEKRPRIQAKCQKRDFCSMNGQGVSCIFGASTGDNPKMVGANGLEPLTLSVCKRDALLILTLI